MDSEEYGIQKVLTGTDVSSFKSNISPGTLAEFEVYENDGVTPKIGTMATGDKVIVTTRDDSAVYDVTVNAIGVNSGAAYDNAILSTAYKFVVLLDDISVSRSRPNDAIIDRSVVVDGNGFTLTFTEGELVIGRTDDNIVVRLENLEVIVHNPFWREPASAYGILVHRGTMIADNIVVDLRWEGSPDAAPAGITTHYGASPGDHTRLGWTVEAVVTNSLIKVYSNSLNPYGFYASAGSTVTVENTVFDISRLDDMNQVQGIAIGAQNELPAMYFSVPNVEFLFPTLTAVGNSAIGNTSHAIMVYRKDVVNDDAEAKAIINYVLANNPGLPQMGILLPSFEIYP